MIAHSVRIYLVLWYNSILHYCSCRLKVQFVIKGWLWQILSWVVLSGFLAALVPGPEWTITVGRTYYGDAHLEQFLTMRQLYTSSIIVYCKSSPLSLKIKIGHNMNHL